MTINPLPRRGRSFALACLLGLVATQGVALSQSPSRLIGRWNLTMEGVDGAYPSWLEVRKSGNSALVGAFVGQFGSSRPVSKVSVEGDRFRFVIPPQWEKRDDDLVFSGRLSGMRLRGRSTDEEGRRVMFSGVRAPLLLRAEPPQWGEPVPLFNGRDLTGWRARSSETPNGWSVEDGLLSNVNPGNDLISIATFEDFKLRAEFRYPEGSNSGIYLRGRYEMQIEDNHGDAPNSLKIGGIYGFLTPSRNAARPAGEWQTAEVTLIGREVTVVFNGERIIDRQAIPGMTGGALDNEEAKPGPIMIQGDHGPIEFRSIIVTPALSDR